MRPRYLIASSALVIAAAWAAAAEQTKSPPQRIHASSVPPIAARTLDPGAIYEAQLQLRSDDIEQYLADYARWFLPVDQNENSGRKLVSALVREHGNQYNLVFLYWYESAYKQHYYCKYLKAFFKYQEANNLKDFVEKYYGPTLKAWGADPNGWARLEDVVEKLPDQCPSGAPSREQDVASDTLLRLESDFRKRVTLEEDSWNFGVDLCKVTKLNAEKGMTTENLAEKCPSGRDTRSDTRTPESWLERAIDQVK